MQIKNTFWLCLTLGEHALVQYTVIFQLYFEIYSYYIFILLNVNLTDTLNDSSTVYKSVISQCNFSIFCILLVLQFMYVTYWCVHNIKTNLFCQAFINSNNSVISNYSLHHQINKTKIFITKPVNFVLSSHQY